LNITVIIATSLVGHHLLAIYLNEQDQYLHQTCYFKWYLHILSYYIFFYTGLRSEWNFLPNPLYPYYFDINLCWGYMFVVCVLLVRLNIILPCWTTTVNHRK